jgi:hypothetical protein
MYMNLYSLLQEPAVHIGIEDEGRPTKTFNVVQLIQHYAVYKYYGRTVIGFITFPLPRNLEFLHILLNIITEYE